MATLMQLANGIRSGRKKYSRVMALKRGPQRRGTISKLVIVSPP